MRYVLVGSLGIVLFLSLSLWAEGQWHLRTLTATKEDIGRLYLRTDRCGVCLTVMADGQYENFTDVGAFTMSSAGTRVWRLPMFRGDPLGICIPYWLTAALSGIPLAWMWRRRRKSPRGFPLSQPAPDAKPV